MINRSGTCVYPPLSINRVLFCFHSFLISYYFYQTVHLGIYLSLLHKIAQRICRVLVAKRTLLVARRTQERSHDSLSNPYSQSCLECNMHTLHRDIFVMNRFLGQWVMVLPWERTFRILTWGATIHLSDLSHLGNSFIHLSNIY